MSPAAGIKPDPRSEAIWAVIAGVMDPEIPVVSLVDLGIAREVRMRDGRHQAVITPTYSGCPATRQIEQDLRTALDAAGFGDVAVVVEKSPAWTTDWITPEGRDKLRDFGIAPPVKSGGKRALFQQAEPVACPHCGSRHTNQVAEFGSTPCKALWRCDDCREPFDYFKCL